VVAGPNNRLMRKLWY